MNRNTLRLGYCTGAWLVTTALATFGPQFIWHDNTLLTASAIFINLAIGLATILANKHHLQSLDEMQQKIQLEAMALSLGVGFVCGLSYSLLDQSNLMAADAEISHLILLMGLTYLAGTVIGNRRYG
ncbi:MAG: hypothetical protein HOA27_08620 [Gemmatimonadetes bacterium]|nr:hypothetical protein [Gemmatimonadota bacterium]MBT5452575.1 hypothetical protein [Gemmatimonadota bacterium]MBT6623072.1 hypothetical protein [Gemmatimonadota bacterium]MBT6904219.1 hypothetical protein [Gemmatimonadota bacterium]MBT7416988.1 hypothetical protein [Gemmatimonadota bacterium]